MKKFTHALVAVSPVFFWLLISFSGGGAHSQAEAQAQTGAQYDANSAFEKSLAAHGGWAAITRATSYRVEAVRLISTFPTEFIERRMTLSVDGERFRRSSDDSTGAVARAEMFDGLQLRAALRLKRDDGSTASRSIPVDGDRLRALRFNVDTFGLLPLLRICADSVAIAEGRAGSLDKFRIRTARGDWIVYTDQAGLIRRLERGDKVFQFADYRQVGELRLPFIERLSIGDRLIYELIFSAIEINPDFPPDHFDTEPFSR
ncbi:MAG TPA: hypothetical protein VID27_09195 [Blastocatellia bacterium]